MVNKDIRGNTAHVTQIEHNCPLEQEQSAQALLQPKMEEQSVPVARPLRLELRHRQLTMPVQEVLARVPKEEPRLYISQQEGTEKGQEKPEVP